MTDLKQFAAEQADAANAKGNYQAPKEMKANQKGTINADESNVDESGVADVPGADPADVKVGRSGLGAGGGDNQKIPVEEGGGSWGPGAGRDVTADDFEGHRGPEDKARAHAAMHGGDNDVRSNIR
ncbi:hypothetical protein YB2330_001558 [Saitoella coloradoensis]